MIYLASPYTHPDKEVRQYRYEEACKAAGFLMKKGKYVFSPIAHSHGIALYCDMPVDFGFWKEHCINMLLLCDSILVLDINGWRESLGIKKELTVAITLGIKAGKITPDGDDWRIL